MPRSYSEHYKARLVQARHLVKMSDLLREHLQPAISTSGKPACRYDTGWSDQRVVNISRIKLSVVQGTRCALYGVVMGQKRSTVSKQELKDEVFQLKEQIAQFLNPDTTPGDCDDAAVSSPGWSPEDIQKANQDARVEF